jgi:hypothetical protein
MSGESERGHNAKYYGPNYASFPERASDPRDDLTGWERPEFACGCGRNCSSWSDHYARKDVELAARDREDVAEEMAGEEASP